MVHRRTLPFDPKRGVERKEPSQAAGPEPTEVTALVLKSEDDGPTLPFGKRPKVSKPTASAPDVPDEERTMLMPAVNAPMALTLEQYAAFRAEVDADPTASGVKIAMRYGLTAAGRAVVESHYGRVMALDVETRQAFDRAYGAARGRGGTGS